MMPDDHDLLIAWTARGDEAAFAALAARYAGLVHATCRRRLGDAEADDAAQAVFLVLLRKAPSLVRRPRPLAVWLFVVASRVAANVARGRERRLRHENAAAREHHPASGQDRQWDEVRPHLDAVLDDLPDRYRAPLVLHYLQGLDRRATAASLGLTDEAAKKRLQRGLERARAALARRGVTIGAGLLGGMLAGRAEAAAPASILPHLTAIPHATASPAIMAIAKGAAPMILSSTALIVATLTLGTISAGSAIAHPVPPGAEQRQAGSTAATSPGVAAAMGATMPRSAGGTPGTDAHAPAPDGDAAPAPAAIPQAAQVAYEEAEARWRSAAEAGDVVTSPTAPELARLYSAVLQALYHQPGAQALADRIVADRLTPLGTALFFSTTRYPDDALFGVHTAVDGDVPDTIAKDYGMTSQQLNRLRDRDVDDRSLRAGETLKVIRTRENGGSVLHAVLGDYHVDAYVGGVFARRYDIAIGAPQSPTPVGRTRVTDLVLDPRWTDPATGQVYPPEDPRDLLGGAWIALSPDGIGRAGIGLLGSAGGDQRTRTRTTNGGLRLDNHAIRELAWLIGHPTTSPTRVIIVE